MRKQLEDNFIIPRRRKMAPNLAYWNLVLQTHPKVKEYYDCLINLEYSIYKDGFSTTLVYRKEWERVANCVSNKVIKDQDYFTKLEKETDRAKKKILKFLKKQARHTKF